jgi:hypothetical protein
MKCGPRHEELFNTIKKRKQEHNIFVLGSFGALGKKFSAAPVYTDNTVP